MHTAGLSPSRLLASFALDPGFSPSYEVASIEQLTVIPSIFNLASLRNVFGAFGLRK